MFLNQQTPSSIITCHSPVILTQYSLQMITVILAWLYTLQKFPGSFFSDAKEKENQQNTFHYMKSRSRSRSGVKTIETLFAVLALTENTAFIYMLKIYGSF